jgi:hypothetical protein
MDGGIRSYPQITDRRERRNKMGTDFAYNGIGI